MHKQSRCLPNGILGDELPVQFRAFACCLSARRVSLTVIKLLLRSSLSLVVRYLETCVKGGIASRKKAFGIGPTAQLCLEHIDMIDQEYWKRHHYDDCDYSILTLVLKNAIKFDDSCLQDRKNTSFDNLVAATF
jgi:hypothetical protein